MKKNATHREWFWLNLRIGLLSFVPASRAALYREEVVDQYGWLSADDFNEALTIGQLLPGPNLVNLSVYIGWRLLGPSAVLSGLLGLALPGAIVAVLLYLLLPTQNPQLAELFQGFALAGVALMVVFLFHLDSGIRRADLETRPRRAFARLVILCGVATAMASGAPLLWVLLLGVPLSLAAEFSL